jgi:hypothetical protein
MRWNKHKLILIDKEYRQRWRLSKSVSELPLTRSSSIAKPRFIVPGSIVQFFWPDFAFSAIVLHLSFSRIHRPFTTSDKDDESRFHVYGYQTDVTGVSRNWCYNATACQLREPRGYRIQYESSKHIFTNVKFHCCYEAWELIIVTPKAVIPSTSQFIYLG